MDIEVNINNVEYIYLNHNYLVSKNDKLSKLRQSRKQIIVSSILPKNKRNSLSWVEKVLRILSENRSLGEFEIYWPNTGQMLVMPSFWSPLKVTQKFHTQNLIQALLL